MSEQTVDIGYLSQWQLIRLRFKRHRLAVAGLFLIVVLYSLALFAEFVAPYPSHYKDLHHTFNPPQTVRFNFDKGFYTYGMRLHLDTVSFKRDYVEDKNDIIPLSFFVKGTPYKLWGLFSGTRHAFGVDLEAYQDERPAFHFLGADQYGQDILSRIIYGARISLSVGLISIIVTFLLGVFIGGVSGYIGGRVDNVIQRTIEIINAFPQLPLWLALGAALPSDWSPLRIYFSITLVLSLLGWTGLARVVRGKLLALREEDYAMAARLLGASHKRILFRHLLPGITSHIIVELTLRIPVMILGETSLSFLGLGLRSPVVSWGVMLQDCMNIQGVANYPWLLMPVVFIVMVVLCFNFLGDGLRDAADPYSSR